MDPFVCDGCKCETWTLVYREAGRFCPACKDEATSKGTYIKRMAPESMRKHKPKMSYAEYMNLKTRKVGWDGRTRPNRRWR